MLPLSSRSIQLPAEIASVATAPAPDAPADSPATQSTHASTSTTGTAIHDHVWLTSLVLADILLALDPRLLHNRHCLELGCGTGLASAAAAMAGARVCASDVQPNALRVAASTALRNGTALAECRHLDWRAYHDKEEESDAVVTVDDESVGYHLVIASDVMYMGNAVRPLARTIKRMLGEAGVAVVVDPGRCYCDDFVEVCGELGFAQVHRVDYTYLKVVDNGGTAVRALRNCSVVLLAVSGCQDRASSEAHASAFPRPPLWSELLSVLERLHALECAPEERATVQLSFRL